MFCAFVSLYTETGHCFRVPSMLSGQHANHILELALEIGREAEPNSHFVRAVIDLAIPQFLHQGS